MAERLRIELQVLSISLLSIKKKKRRKNQANYSKFLNGLA